MIKWLETIGFRASDAVIEIRICRKGRSSLDSSLDDRHNICDSTYASREALIAVSKKFAGQKAEVVSFSLDELFRWVFSELNSRIHPAAFKFWIFL